MLNFLKDPARFLGKLLTSLDPNNPTVLASESKPERVGMKSAFADAIFNLKEYEDGL